MSVGIHYQVSFLHQGEVRYGIVECCTRSALEHAKQGELLVADAILPQAWVIEERFVQDEPIGSGDYEDYLQKEFRKAMKVSDGVEGCKKGKVIRFHINSGYAYYVVTKVTKTLAHLEWRGFDADRWVEPVLGYSGKMSRSRAEAIIKWEDEHRQPPESK